MGSSLITGGCGFIGSHLVEALLTNQNDRVIALDNLSSGDLKNLEFLRGSKNFDFMKTDLVEPGLQIPNDCDVVYHLAANPGVRVGSINPNIHFNQSVVATHNLLQAIRRTGAKLPPETDFQLWRVQTGFRSPYLFICIHLWIQSADL
jgi:UDP-glucose 4-epimerase